MAHWVTRKGKYVSLEESYRDERGRPRKRILQYLGIPSIDWRASFTGGEKDYAGEFAKATVAPAVSAPAQPAETSPQSQAEAQAPSAEPSADASQGDAGEGGESEGS